MTSKYLAGVDEVGRGCLAGPVVSAAIILKKSANKENLVDSKSISSKKRHDLASYILMQLGVEYVITLKSTI